MQIRVQGRRGRKKAVQSKIAPISATTQSRLMAHILRRSAGSTARTGSLLVNQESKSIVGLPNTKGGDKWRPRPIAEMLTNAGHLRPAISLSRIRMILSAMQNKGA